METSWTWKRAIQPGIRAAKEHWRPLSLIQVAAIGGVFLYYSSLPVREWGASVAELKSRSGLLFAASAGFIAGAILPEIAKALTGRLRGPFRKWLADTAYNGLAYAILAVWVDLFYQLQARIFGPGNDILTLVWKTLFDMGVFATVLAVPFMVGFYHWRKTGFRLREFKGLFTWRAYRDRVLPALIPNWAFWIPVVVCVYAMPVGLQFPFTVLAEAAWSIMFVYIATTEHD